MNKIFYLILIISCHAFSMQKDGPVIRANRTLADFADQIRPHLELRFYGENSECDDIKSFFESVQGLPYEEEPITPQNFKTTTQQRFVKHFFEILNKTGFVTSGRHGFNFEPEFIKVVKAFSVVEPTLGQLGFYKIIWPDWKTPSKNGSFRAVQRYSSALKDLKEKRTQLLKRKADVFVEHRQEKTRVIKENRDDIEEEEKEEEKNNSALATTTDNTLITRPSHHFHNTTISSRYGGKKINLKATKEQENKYKRYWLDHPFVKLNISTEENHLFSDIKRVETKEFLYRSLNPITRDSNERVTFVLAGRTMGALVPTETNGGRVIVVLTHKEASQRQLQKFKPVWQFFVKRYQDVLIINDMHDEDTNAVIPEEKRGLVTTRRLAILKFAHEYNLHHAMMLDDNLKNIFVSENLEYLRGKDKSWSTFYDLFNTISSAENIACLSAAHLSGHNNRHGVNAHEIKLSNKLSSKVFFLNFDLIAPKIVDNYHLRSLLPYKLNVWGEDFYFQVALKNLSLSVTMVDRDCIVVQRSQKHANACRKSVCSAMEWLKPQSLNPHRPAFSRDTGREMQKFVAKRAAILGNLFQSKTYNSEQKHFIAEFVHWIKNKIFVSGEDTIIIPIDFIRDYLARNSEDMTEEEIEHRLKRRRKNTFLEELIGSFAALSLIEVNDGFEFTTTALFRIVLSALPNDVEKTITTIFENA